MTSPFDYSIPELFTDESLNPMEHVRYRSNGEGGYVIATNENAPTPGGDASRTMYFYARELASYVLGSAGLGERLERSQGVANRMSMIYNQASPEVYDLVMALGVVHDIGYAFSDGGTGHHGLDGAHFLQRTNLKDLAPYVAWHTTSEWEADYLGVEIDVERPLDKKLHADLALADMLTDEQGGLTNIEDRVKEIMAVYGPKSAQFAGVVQGGNHFSALLIHPIERLWGAGTGEA